MIKRKWIGVIAAVLMAVAVLVTGAAYLNPSALAPIAGANEPAYISAMDKTKIMDIQIVADEKEWAKTMQKAMEIIQAAGKNELTEEQLAKLKELGLTDGQITQFKSMAQGGSGGMGRQPPENAKGEGNNLTAGQNQGVGSRHATVTSGFDTNTWLFIGGCTILLLIGIFSVSFFKRRRYS